VVAYDEETGENGSYKVRVKFSHEDAVIRYRVIPGLLQAHAPW